MNSYLDIRKKQISLGLTAVYGAVGLVYILLDDQQLIVALLGIIPGVMMLCIGKMSGGALGAGDGLIVLVSGMYMGIWKTIEFIARALLMAAVWAGFLMAGKKKGRQACFPFVPFLLVSYVVSCLIRAEG